MDVEKIKSLQEYFETKNVIQAILFGSHARDTATRKSDWDLIIIQNTEDRFFDRYPYFNDLYDLADDRLDLLIYTPDEWESIKNRPFFRNILKEAKTIYVS